MVLDFVNEICIVYPYFSKKTLMEIILKFKRDKNGYTN